MLRVVQPYPSNLALLSDLKLELGITGPEKDTLLMNSLRRSSDSIAAAIGRPVHRQQYRESAPSYGVGKLYVTATPLAGQPEACWMRDPYYDFDSTILTPIENLYVRSREAGVLETINGLWSTQRYFPESITFETVVGTEIDLLRIDYWGGWHPPGSIIAKTTLSFEALDQSVNDSASGFPPSIQKDDLLTITGAADNNGLYRVISASSSKLILSGSTTITDAVAGGQVVIDYRSLPGDIEDAVLMYAKTIYLSRSRDVGVRYQRTQDLEVWYLREADVGTRFPPQILFVVNSYKRVLQG